MSHGDALLLQRESAAAAAVAGSRGELEKTARLLAYVLVGVIG